MIDYAKVIAKCRKLAAAGAAKLNLEADEDVMELPVVLSDERRVGSTCGCFQHVAGNGLGRIVIHTKKMHDEAFLEATLLHEFAHALVHFLRAGEPDPTGSHGKTFAFVMLTMGREPSKYVKGASDIDPTTVYTT